MLVLASSSEENPTYQWLKQSCDLEHKIATDLKDILTALRKEKQSILLMDRLPLQAQSDGFQLSTVSYRLGFADFITCQNNRWIADSLYLNVFFRLLTRTLQKQSLSGLVLFLGLQPLAVPIIEAAHKLGFNHFVFLKTEHSEMEQTEVLERTKAFLNIKIDWMESHEFLNDQRSYALCFVMDQDYEAAVIEDMSYFHFLSENSCVFDIAKARSFQFDGVEDIGVPVVRFEEWMPLLLDSIKARENKSS